MSAELPQEIATDRLLLRPPRAADAEDVYRNIADWEVVSRIARPPWPYPRALADEFVRTASAMVIEHDGEVIGAVGVAQRTHGHNLGYWLGRRHWGRGLMTEAAQGLIAAFFAERGDEPLHSSYLLDNVASWRVQEKLGFVAVAPCALRIASRDAELPGMTTLLRRDAFLRASNSKAAAP